MTKKKHVLVDLWENYGEVYPNRSSYDPVPAIGKYLSEVLAIGPFYHYIVNLSDSSIFNVNENIKPMLGFADYPASLREIIDRIHPDDIDFVLEAEKACLEKIREIGFQYILHLKTGYCFRMRVADGSYHLFHHQAMHLNKDESEKVALSLNIHTDIHHITNVNNHIAVVSGVAGRKDFHQIDLSGPKKLINIAPILSKREMEVLPLIAGGLSSGQIADKLCISVQTVRVHRKNILKKTGTTNSSNLIKKCIEDGLL